MKSILFILCFLIPSLAMAATYTETKSDLINGVWTTQNLLKNPTAQKNLQYWTASGGTFVRTTTASEIPNNADGAFSWDSSAAAQTVTTTAQAIPSGWYGKNGVVSCTFKCASGTCTHTLTADDGTNPLATAQTITSSTSSFVRTSVNFIWPSSGNVRVKLASVASDEVELDWGACHLGLADEFNISQVSQATLAGTLTYARAANCTWSGTSGSYANFSADTDCSAPTVTGSLSANASKIPGFDFNNMPVGNYLIVAQGTFYVDAAASQVCSFRLSDGTTTSNPIYVDANAGTPIGVANQIVWTLPVTSAGTKTIQVQHYRSGGAGNCAVDAAVATMNNDLVFQVYRFPTTAETAYSAGQVKLPTVQTFTSGTNATYTRPNGVTHIKVKMVGGGGGGGGGGTTNGSAGTNGGATYFGPNPSPALSPYLQANGGNAGSRAGTGASGGSATISSPAFGTAITGGFGSSGNGYSGASNNFIPSAGHGGSSCLSGGGYGGTYTASAGGSNGPTNSGAGGGGGGTDLATNGSTGPGGGAGGCIEAWIQAPPATLYYTVGAAGSGQAAGTSGGAGGNGGAGYIEVTEYYGANMPILVGGVTAPDYAGATKINTIVSKSGNYTATDAEETIVFTADATLTLPAAASFKGKKYHVVVSGSGVDVTIDPNGSETVCGKTTIFVGRDGDEVTIQSNGTNWIGLENSCFRTEYVIFGGGASGGAPTSTCAGSPCTVASQSSEFVSSVTRSSTGVYSGTIVTGAFSTVPSCTCSAGWNAVGSGGICTVSGSSVTNIIPLSYANNGSGAQDNAISVVCTGPR